MAKLTQLVVRDMGIVDRPANRKPIILKSDKPDADGYYDVEIPLRITKSQDGRLIYGIAYEANVEDSQGDWTDEETLTAAAHEWMRQGRQREIDIMHDGRLGKGVGVESAIIYPGHPNYPPVQNPAWGMAIEPGEEAMIRIKDGDLKGLSISGKAKYDFSAKPPVKSQQAKAARQTAFKVTKERTTFTVTR